MLELNKIYHGDCLELLPEIPDKSIDLILADLPYGCLDCDWDKPLDLNALFTEYNRIIKDKAAIIFTATCKFGYKLIKANEKYFRYDLVWRKSMAVGFANSHKQPLRSHELILVFYKKSPPYHPQGLIEIESKKERRRVSHNKEYAYRPSSLDKPYTRKYTNYPKSILEFPNGNNESVHAAQNPVPLFRYLIETYTDSDAIVLDSCIGSGTTAVAAIESGRQFIGIEKDIKYYELTIKRIEETLHRKEMTNSSPDQRPSKVRQKMT